MMATDLLQDLEGLSVNAHLEQAYLQADISNFEEVEEIVKSNLRMISLMTDDENAQDGFPEHNDGYDDLLGILNLQSSDLEEKDTTEGNEKPAGKLDTEEGQNESCSNCEIAAENPEMPQTSKDLLDDITLVINRDKNFTDDHHLMTSKAERFESIGKETPGSDQASGKLDATLRLVNKELIKADSAKIPFIDECFVEDLDNHSLDPEKENSDPTRNFLAKDVYFEQSLNDLLNGGSSEVLATQEEQNVYQENLLEAPQSLDNLSENSLVERSCNLLPWQSFRDVNGTVKATVKSRLAQEPPDDHDITVDGEGEDNYDGSSLDLCPLSYDENLTCSFYELLQLSNDDNSELIEHGQRGRPPRQKVTRQAVPCKIEPKVSQAGLQPAFLPPQFLSPTFQNNQLGQTSVASSQLQPCLGQEMVRFPVLLHSKTNSSGQLYLEVCPDITQLTATSQPSILSSIPPPDGSSCSSKGNSEKACLSSKIEVTPEKTHLIPSTDTSSQFAGESPRVSQNQLSLEIDGPIRRQSALSQGRNGSSRNDPYFRMAMGNSGQVGSSGPTVANAAHAIGSLLEEPYRMQTVQGNQTFAVSSHNLVPSSFVNNPNLIRAQVASGFGGSVQNGMPYFSTSMEGSFYQNNQNVPVSNALLSYGMYDQQSQFLLQTSNQYAPGNNASSTNAHNHHYCHDVVGEQLGNWMREPNANIQASSTSHCLANNNNPSRHTASSGAAPYARINSPGLPNIPVDPLSRRVQILMTMGVHGQRQVKVDSSSSDVHSAGTSQNLARFTTSNNEYNNSMIQLSPPAELKKPQFVNQHNINPPDPAHVPSSGATADGSVVEKSVFHPKGAPSHSSTRSSKGPDLPVPTERSKSRVEQWLKNNVMFRPDLDSGTFDPSDYSLLHANIPHTSHPEAAGSEQALSEQNYEYPPVGIFEGKRIMVVPSQPSSKQKPIKRTGAGHHHRKGSPLTQAGLNRHSETSAITESSLSSGYTNISQDKYTESKQEASNEGQKPPGRKPVALHTLDHLDENQQADLAIAEDMKQLEQTSFEKRLAGITSSSSDHVLSELEQYLRSEISPSGGTSGNLPGSGLRLEAVVSGNSKQSSFDTSKYITPSEMESLEKKKTQNGKNSLDSYLEQVKYVSNESMHAEHDSLDQSDGKQLKNIPLNDIAEVIGLQRELNQQQSRRENCWPHSQFKNSQKAVKRRPDETVHQMGQIVEVGEQNTVMGEQNVVMGGQSVVIGGQQVVKGEQTLVVGEQHTLQGTHNVAVGRESYAAGGQRKSTAMHGQNTKVGQKNATNVMYNNNVPEMLAQVSGTTQVEQKMSLECLPSKALNVGDQHFMVFSEPGGIHQTVVGPPTTQPDFLMKNSSTQHAKFSFSNTTLPGSRQMNPAYEPSSSQAFSVEQAALQTLNSGKIQADFQVPNFTDYYETEMRSTPSSVEIIKESRPGLNNDFFIVSDPNRNELVPGSSVSSTQYVMQPVMKKISPAVASLPQSSSLSSLTQSTTASASQMSNAYFKKPQNPSCSSGSSTKDCRPGAPSYPSVGGDSDVSMSSDTSLPTSMAVHDGSIDPTVQIHQQQLLSTQQHLEQYSVQFQQMSPRQLGQNMLQSTQVGQNILQSTQVGQNMLQSIQVGQNMLQSTQKQVGQNMLQSTQKQVVQNMLQSSQVGQNMLQSSQVGQNMLQSSQVGQNMLQSSQVGQNILQSSQVGQNMLQSSQVGQNMLQSSQVGQNMLQSSQVGQNMLQSSQVGQNMLQSSQVGQNMLQSSQVGQNILQSSQVGQNMLQSSQVGQNMLQSSQVGQNMLQSSQVGQNMLQSSQVGQNMLQSSQVGQNMLQSSQVGQNMLQSSQVGQNMLQSSQVGQNMLQSSQVGQNMLQSSQVGQNMLQSSQVGQNMLQSSKVGQNMLQSSQQQVGQNMLQSSQVGQNMLQSSQVGQNMLQSSQVGQNMLQSSQVGQSSQQVQSQKQEQLVNQQYTKPKMEQNRHQQQFLLQQQKHPQTHIENQQQIGSQDYYQLQKQHHQILNQQNIQFLTRQQMHPQQQQEIQNSQQYCEDQQKQLQHLRNQQQFEEMLLKQQSNQQEQVYLIQIKKQQQIEKQRQYLQQQMADQQQIQNHQHLHSQNQQQGQIQQLQKQPGEMSHSHLLQSQQQMQQYQLLLNQQHYQQMQVQQLQQQQIQQLQQQKQIESQQLQQQQRLFQEQYSEQNPAFTNTCIPRGTPGSRAGSTCSEPQPYRILPGTKFETRSMSQISDAVYSQQLANLSPASESTHDLQTFADNDLALLPLTCQQLTNNSNQLGHRKNNFNNIHNDSMSGQNQQEGLENFNKSASGNQTVNTAASIQQPSPGNIEIAEQDQNLKSATETQLQKYLKEGFPSLHSVEYCQEGYTMSSFSPANISSLPQDKHQQSLDKSGQGMDSGDGSSDKSNREQPAERSREQADSDLSVFSLGSGGDLLSFQQDNDGETPLHLLSELPKEGISSLPSMPGFYEALNLQNKNQETALDIAVKNENLDAVKFLVSHGADVNIFCLSSQKSTGSKAVHRNETVQQTALHEAVELGNREIVKVLLTSQNVKVDARRPDSGLTPLMLALQLHRQSDRKEIISELINHQASLRLHDTIQGKTPLMFAIQSRDVSLVEGILQQVGAEEARALVSERAKKDMTCLHFAAELRLESVLKKRLLRCIIVAGGDPSAKNSEGETPRDWAKTDINEVLQNLARLFSP